MDIVVLTVCLTMCCTFTAIGCRNQYLEDMEHTTTPVILPDYPLTCHAILIDRPHWNVKCINKNERFFLNYEPDYYYTTSEWFDDRTKAALLPDAGAMLRCRIEKKSSKSRRFPFVKSKKKLSCVLEDEYTRQGNSEGIKCKWGVECMTPLVINSNKTAAVVVNKPN
jgi:hypothetical protein